MAKQRKLSRRLLTLAVLVIIGGALTVAFVPHPLAVDIGSAERADLMVTIDEEGRTQVRESYIVSAPVAGVLERVQIHAGDYVEEGTVVARMHTTNPAALDVRTREQAHAVVDAAEAGLRVAQADLSAATSNEELARSGLDRTRQLAASGIESQAALDRAEGSARAARAGLETARAAIAIREAELANARSQLIGFEDPGLANAIDNDKDMIPLRAPITGRILRIVQESETTLPPGAPVLVIGDIATDLEVVIELVSSDAVQVEVGAPVIYEGWGGSQALQGIVTRIDPIGVTKVSALGVEEQRVNVYADLTSPQEERERLGHGYRLEARVVIWQAEDILTVPASALFRDDGGWSLFRVEAGLAQQRSVEVGESDGLTTQIVDGLTEGDQVVLYPSGSLESGQEVTQRISE